MEACLSDEMESDRVAETGHRVWWLTKKGRGQEQFIYKPAQGSLYESWPWLVEKVIHTQ